MGPFDFSRFLATIIKWWDGLFLHIRLAQVKVIQCDHVAVVRSGARQPGNLVYPDTESLTIQAQLGVPTNAKVFPLLLLVEVIPPSSQRGFRLVQSVDRPVGNSSSLQFTLSREIGVFRTPGKWEVRIQLLRTNWLIGSHFFTVISETELNRDLKMVSGIICRHEEGARYNSHFAFVDTHTVTLSATIVPINYHVSKFIDRPIYIDFFRSGKSVAGKTIRAKASLVAGTNSLAIRVEVPIAEDHLLGIPGHYEIVLRLDRSVIGQIPFDVITLEQARKSVSLKNIELVGSKKQTGFARLGQKASVQKIDNIAVHLSFQTIYPSPFLKRLLGVAAVMGNNIIAFAEHNVIFPEQSAEIAVFELTIPEGIANDGSTRLRFHVILDNAVVGTREIIFCRPPRYCANNQGCLRPEAVRGIGEEDLASEYAEIQRAMRG
ncbi:MAG: hypothetical protein UY62_C0030G0004 [Parcubacteria group bacterium GW2011_GWF2_50_9]|nr:MAG: hypothetical protein UY62_C0030G0004 [Parcubacteria group bacterium GW2011_GWF2_50_9]